MNVTRELVLDEIRRLATEKGRPPGQKRFAAMSGIQEHGWRRYWARWGDAVAEAGFEPNSMVAPLDKGLVLDRLALEVRRLGRMPTGRERELVHRDDHTFPSEHVYRRLGTRQHLISKLADHCRGRSEPADVLAIVEPLGEEDLRGTDERDPSVELALGFVYLLRSGRYYKIGRTNAIGRRQYELAIQLPEKATIVHEIRTDDPMGIETYWHRRFADRRKNGEWFELTRDDVAAFRRRTFQ